MVCIHSVSKRKLHKVNRQVESSGGSKQTDCQTSSQAKSPIVLPVGCTCTHVLDLLDHIANGSQLLGGRVKIKSSLGLDANALVGIPLKSL